MLGVLLNRSFANRIEKGRFIPNLKDGEFSHPILIWSLGLSLHWWDGGLSGLPLVGMYFVFSTSNIYGLIKK
jgi:hypothetical protein